MNQRSFVCLVGAVALCMLPNLASAQPGRGGGGFGGGFGGGGDMFLLNDENVQKDLEILDSQKEKLASLRDKIGEEMRALFQGGNGGGQDAREKMREKMEGFQKEMSDILLPHQRDRLKQIGVQSRLRFGSTSNAIGDALELSDEDKKKLADKDKELTVEMNKEIAKIREKYRDKLLDVLGPDQKAKWKQLVGNPIEFAPTAQFGQGGRGGAGGGGGSGGRPGRSTN
jgi:Spy/CpxP family protein refolding chaperone